MTEITRLAAEATVFHAWNEDANSEDVNALYATLDIAKAYAAYEYESCEYGEPDPEDDPTDRPALAWHQSGDRWALIDGGKDTGIRIDKRPVLRPATPEEIDAQDQARAARAAITA